jgi:archaeosine-15-forming tRNA-guanine transglycosylase
VAIKGIQIKHSDRIRVLVEKKQDIALLRSNLEWLQLTCPTEKARVVGEPWRAVKIDDTPMASLYKADGPFSLKEEAADILQRTIA